MAKQSKNTAAVSAMNSRKFKSNHQIGCIMRNFKRYGYGEMVPTKSIAPTVSGVTKDRLIVELLVFGPKANLSRLDGDFN